MQSHATAIVGTHPLQTQTLAEITMPITIRPLTPVFAAEITHVDLTRPLDDATFAEVENAFETYSILVFPRQNLTDAMQIAFSSRFGALESTQGHIANNFQVKQIS